MSRATIGSTNDGCGGETDRGLPGLQDGASGFSGLIGLVDQALAHQIIDDGQAGKRLSELNFSIGPRPQAFAIQELLKSFRFRFVQNDHTSRVVPQAQAGACVLPRATFWKLAYLKRDGANGDYTPMQGFAASDEKIALQFETCVRSSFKYSRLSSRTRIGGANPLHFAIELIHQFTASEGDPEEGWPASICLARRKRAQRREGIQSGQIPFRPC